MQDFAFLKLLDKLRLVFRLLGVEYTHMRRILQVKLTLDSRRITTIVSNYNNSESSNTFHKALLINLLFGAMPMLFVFIGDSPFLGMSAFFGMVMFLLVTTLISDFSAVMLDVSERSILYSRPVGPRTISAAKTIHMFYYLFLLCGAISGPGIVAATIKYGPLYGLLMIATAVFMCLLSLSLTAMVYSVILKFFDGEKLKDVINLFQIIVMIVVSLGYQLVGRMFNVVGWKIAFAPRWWTYLLPPAWFAAPFEMLVVRHTTTPLLVLSILAGVIPLVATIWYVRVVSPAFDQDTAKLMTSERVKNYRKPLLRRLFELLARLVSVQPVERALVKFFGSMLTRERSVKLRMYPSLALSLFFPVLLIFSRVSQRVSPWEALQTLGKGNNFLFVYVSAALLATLSSMLFFSDSYRGAWVFKALPIKDVSQVTQAAVKAIILIYIFPSFLFLYIALLPLLGFARTLDFAIIFLSSILGTVAVVRLCKDRMPFSEKYVQSQAGTTGAVLACMVLVGTIAGIHVLLIEHQLLVLGLGFVLLGLTALLWNDSIRYYFQRNKAAMVAAATATMVLISTLTGIYYYRLGNAVVNTITSSAVAYLPLGRYPEVDAVVRLGGDDLKVYAGRNTLSMRTCFYTEDGILVAAAHNAEVESGQYRLLLNGGYTERAMLDSSGPSGIILSGLQPPEDALEVSFAKPYEVVVGAEATLVHRSGNIPVLHLGYTRMEGNVVLVIQTLDTDVDIGPGFSGSPIVQDDKLVGFLSMAIKPGFRYKGPRIAFARLATEVYLETIGKLDVGSGK